MQKEIRDRWVDALRSGRYEQGGGSLKAGNKFCCLGVLCDVVGFDLDQTRETVGLAHRTWGISSGLGVAPAILEELLDFDIRNRLALLNDNGSTFSEIADRIEETVEVTA